MKNPRNLYQQGFSLTEILVVIVIIGILVLLALPNLENVIGRARQTEARLQLKHVYTLQKAYFYEHDRYGKDLQKIGFEQEKLVTHGGNARYQIEILRADGASFVARAIAVTDHDQDGELNTWEVDEDGEIQQIKTD